MGDEQPTELLQTPLHALHVELGGRMVPFAGYQMPVQYPLGILKEHLHTRDQASLFDVSHMGQVRLTGDNVAAALERIVPVDILGLKKLCQRYALFTDEQGGIMDDLMVTNLGDQLFMVVNAACKKQDIEHMQSQIGSDCDIAVMNEYALLALQGPAAAKVLSRFAAEVSELVFMTGSHIELCGVECFVTRSGYTGEDGFEISVPAEHTEQLARELLAQPEVQPAGLGARDSLRLEAGLCLYGHDIDTTTSPVEASLVWALSKCRRADGERAGGYPGAEIILQQLSEGVSRRRVGILPVGRAPVREGAELVNGEGRKVGKVTSGGFGPSLGAPVAMGYVESRFADIGSELFALVRDKQLPVTVAKIPFVPQRYYRGT